MTMYNIRLLIKRLSYSALSVSKLKVVHCCVLQRSLYRHQVLRGGYTAQLLPEIENLLESGDMKHRKHSGIRKRTPVALPEKLKNSVDQLICDVNEGVLLLEGESIWKKLISRRLPLEQEEVNARIRAQAPMYDGDFESLSEIINEKELKMIKKRIYAEVCRWKPINYDNRTGLAYLVKRLPANYASVYSVLGELKSKFPSYEPKSFFDFGSGVGSAMWAAHSHWGNEIKEYFCVDISAEMNDINLSLISDGNAEQKLIDNVYFRQFLPASETVKYDVVVSAFSLLDLPSAMDRLKVIDTLWRKTKDFLVVIEFGNAAGFHSVLDARDFILQVENNPAEEFSYYSSGAYVVSPCPHDLQCPKFLEDRSTSCGFAVSYQVQYPKRLSKAIAKDWISYVILKKEKRPEGSTRLPRVVKPVLAKPQHVHCDLCCSDGLLRRLTFTKRKNGRHIYRCARMCSQGDILPVSILSTEKVEDKDIH